MRAQVAQGVAYQRRYARSNDPVIPPRWLGLHNIKKVTVPLRCKPVCYARRRDRAESELVAHPDELIGLRRSLLWGLARKG